MRRIAFVVPVFAALASAQDVPALPAPAVQPVDFVRDIAPILRANCIECHGPDQQRSGYRLDIEAIALAGGDGHAPNIVPGNGAGSPLLQFVSGLDAELRMPPEGARLTTDEIARLRRWIDDGAVWPDDASAKTADPLDWWSLQPLQKPALPKPPRGRHRRRMPSTRSSSNDWPSTSS